MRRQNHESAAICIATKTASDESTGVLILRVKGSSRMVLAENGMILEIEPWNRIISDTRRYQKIPEDTRSKVLS